MANPNIQLDVLTDSLSEWRFTQDRPGRVHVERMTALSMRYQLIATIDGFPAVRNGDRVKGDDLDSPVGRGYFISSPVVDHRWTVLP